MNLIDEFVSVHPNVDENKILPAIERRIISAKAVYHKAACEKFLKDAGLTGNKKLSRKFLRASKNVQMEFMEIMHVKKHCRTTKVRDRMAYVNNLLNKCIISSKSGIKGGDNNTDSNSCVRSPDIPGVENITHQFRPKGYSENTNNINSIDESENTIKIERVNTITATDKSPDENSTSIDFGVLFAQEVSPQTQESAKIETIEPPPSPTTHLNNNDSPSLKELKFLVDLNNREPSLFDTEQIEEISSLANLHLLPQSATFADEVYTKQLSHDIYHRNTQLTPEISQYRRLRDWMSILRSTIEDRLKEGRLFTFGSCSNGYRS